jgi:UDP-glucose 4-epimerase
VARVVVTGGAGFIGSNVVRLLVDQGDDVSVLDDISSGYRGNLADTVNVELYEGDVREQGLLDEICAGADVVFHLAAAVGNLQSIENPERDTEINVLGTLRVLEAARRCGVRKVVYSSSAAIFGELKHLPIREDHPIAPNSPYGVSKLAGEKMCLAYAMLYGLEAVALRYFNVYGVHQRFDAYGNVIPIFVHRLLHGEPLTIFSDGEQTRDFVNVADVARANLLAARAEGVSGAFNVASGGSITINRLVELLTDASGVEPTVEYRPPRPGDVRNSLADVSEAGRQLGWEPRVDLDEGLAEYVAWMRSDVVTSRRAR